MQPLSHNAKRHWFKYSHQGPFSFPSLVRFPSSSLKVLDMRVAELSSAVPAAGEPGGRSGEAQPQRLQRLQQPTSRLQAGEHVRPNPRSSLQGPTAQRHATCDPRGKAHQGPRASAWHSAPDLAPAAAAAADSTARRPGCGALGGGAPGIGAPRRGSPGGG